MRISASGTAELFCSRSPSYLMTLLHALPKHLRLLLLSLLLAGSWLLMLAGLLPVEADLQAVSRPAADYEAALARWLRLTDRERSCVRSGNGSRLLSHGRKTARVYLLVHGLTNSPRQWAELGSILHARGHNVVMPRMPYHGLSSHKVAELGRLTAPDLRSYADTAVDISAGLGDEVVALGISGGAVVAAWMAQNRREVSESLLLAPFFGLAGMPALMNTYLMNLLCRLPNLVLQNPRERRREWAYRGEATRGAAAFLLFGRDVVRRAKVGQAPAGRVTILTTAAERTANNAATRHLASLWRRCGTEVASYQFGPERAIPHNAVDPAADPVKKAEVYARILYHLRESAEVEPLESP